MSDGNKHQEGKKASALDIFVTVFCLCGAAASLFMFQHDLFNTMRSFLNLPAGIVAVKYNTVQRRFKDRMIWDRLFNESPVYNGDLIRVARLSGAVITIDNSSIELGENTLIRIQRDAEHANIDFFSGELNVTSSSDGGTIFLSIGDQVIQAPSGTAFGASSGEDGLVLRITEGSARIVRGGQAASASAGTVIIQDAQGREVTTPAAVVIQPRPNARYLQTGDLPFNLNFEWLKVNMLRTDAIRLEIAEDRNFTRLAYALDNLDTSAAAAVNAGLWHWRLLRENTVLASGQVTVTEAPAPALFNAVVSGSDVQLRWAEIDEAASYFLQISRLSDFSNPFISKQVQGTGFVIPELDNGTWFWRVRPSFPSMYEGAAGFSQVSSFQIERSGRLPSVSLNTPAHENIISLEEAREGIYFSWSNSRDAALYTIQISSNSSFEGSIINRTTNNNFFVYGREGASLVPGRYYWRVFYTDTRDNMSPLSQTRSFLVTESDIRQNLVFPPDRYSVEDGQISDLRFNWDTNLLSDRRFQVSASYDFSALVIDAPVGENFYQGLSLTEGEWYWRVSARQSSMSQAIVTAPRLFTVTSVSPQTIAEESPASSVPGEEAVSVEESAQSANERQTASPAPRQAQPVTLLPPPANRRPASGYGIGEQELRQQRNIVFSWNAVEGATSYILTIYKETPSGRAQIFRTEAMRQLSYTFSSLSLFDYTGSYVWQVEALYYNSQGLIERRGQPGENTFTLNVPRPGRIQAGDTGILYGN